MRACFFAWRSAIRSRLIKEHQMRLAQRHAYKCSLRVYFQAWGRIMQTQKLALRLNSQQEQHAHQLVETVNEYQLTIEQVHDNIRRSESAL